MPSAPTASSSVLAGMRWERPTGWLGPGRFAAILLLFLLAAYPDILLGWKTFYFRDFGTFAYPIAHYHRQQFWQGHLPLWNPLSNCGVPFLAQWKTLVLYPGSLVYLLFPLSWSLGVFCLAHLYLGGMGMFSLARRWTGNPVAAAVAGLGYSLSGTLNAVMWPDVIASLGWMPWTVLAVEQGWREGGRKLLIGCFVAALQMLSGTPEVILFTWFFLGLLLMVQGWQERSRRRLWIGRYAAQAAIVTGLTAAQLFPFFQLLAHSQRDQNFANADWSMPSTGWANLLLPIFRCYQDPHGVYFQFGQYWASSYYPGAGVLALALVAASRLRDARTLLLSAITGVSLVLALGDEGHLYRWLRAVVPQFGFMRFPIKFVILAVFCLPLLAALALDAWARADRSERLHWGRALTVVSLMLITLIAGIVWFDFRHPRFEEYREYWPATWKNGLNRAIFLSATAGIVLGNARLQTPLLQLGLISLVGFDLLTHMPRQNPTVPRAVYGPGFVQLASIQRQGPSRAMISPLARRILYQTTISDPAKDYLSKRLALYSNCNLLDGIAKVDGFFPLYLRYSEGVRTRIYESASEPGQGLHDFLGVEYLTATNSLFEWQRRDSALPLVTTGQKPLFLDDDSALELLVSPGFDPRHMVILPAPARDAVGITNQTTAKISNLVFDAQRIELDCQAEAPSVLVLAQAYDHSWRVYINNQPAKLWRANYAFQAVVVPQGRHTVEWIYKNQFFEAGAWISMMTLIGCAAKCWNIPRQPLGSKS